MGRNQGIQGKNVVSKPQRYGQGAVKGNLKGTSQIGQLLGDHVTEKSKILHGVAKPLRDGPMGAMGAVKLGNQVAGETVCQPGGSRTVLRSGFQGTHGPVNPGRSPERKDILSEYGSDHAYARKR